MTLVGRHLLPTRDSRRGAADESLPRLYELGTGFSFVHLPPDSVFDGETLASSRLGQSLGIDVVGIFRRDGAELAPGPQSVLRSGDRLLVRGALDLLSSLKGDEFLALEDENLPVERLLSAGILFAELRCSSSSPFLGRTIRDLDFRNAHGAIVLAMRRGEETLRTGLERRRILEGDVLLVQGTAEQLEALGGLPGATVSYLERADAYHLEERLMAVRVPEGSKLDGATLAESRLGEAFGLGVMGILRGGATHLMPAPDERLRAGDTLLVKGHRQSLASVEGLRGIEVEGEHPDPAALESDEIGMAEVVLSPRTTLVGRTLRNLHFREKYGLTVMAITRAGAVLRTGLRDLPLSFGDALLLYGPRRRLQVLAREPDFLVLTDQDRPPVDVVRAPVATVIMVGVIVAVLTGWLPIYIAAVAGAVLMVLTGCLTMDDAYRAIEWKAVFLIAGMLPLGIAMEQSGATGWITAHSLDLIGGGSPLLLIAGLYLVTAIGAQVMPTPAVAILMAPIALTTAADLGLSPQALLMTVALAASASFMSPIAHPANVLVMGPGDYRFGDYVKVGLPLTLVCLTVALTVLPLVWPLQG
jgi:di/tricarboxylate transporter